MSLSISFFWCKKMAKIDKAGTKQKINKQWPSEDYNQTYPHRRKSVMKAPIWQNIIVQDILPRLPRRGFEIFWVMSKVKIQLQNPDQTSASKSWPNLWLKMLTNLLPQNLEQTSASEFWPNPSLKVLTKNKLQNLDQTSASISWPKTRFKISTKLQLQNLY